VAGCLFSCSTTKQPDPAHGLCQLFIVPVSAPCMQVFVPSLLGGFPRRRAIVLVRRGRSIPITLPELEAVNRSVGIGAGNCAARWCGFSCHAPCGAPSLACPRCPARDEIDPPRAGHLRADLGHPSRAASASSGRFAACGRAAKMGAWRPTRFPRPLGVPGLLHEPRRNCASSRTSLASIPDSPRRATTAKPRTNRTERWRSSPHRGGGLIRALAARTAG